MAAAIIVPVVVLLAIFAVTGVLMPQPTIVSFLVLCTVSIALLVVAAGFLYSYLCKYFNVVRRNEFIESLQAISSRVDDVFNVCDTLTVISKEESTKLGNLELRFEALMEDCSLTKMEVNEMDSRVSGMESKISAIQNVYDLMEVKINRLQLTNDLTNRGLEFLCRTLGNPTDAALITLLYQLGHSGGPNALDDAETQRVRHIAEHVPGLRSAVMRRP